MSVEKQTISKTRTTRKTNSASFSLLAALATAVATLGDGRVARKQE